MAPSVIIRPKGKIFWICFIKNWMTRVKYVLIFQRRLKFSCPPFHTHTVFAMFNFPVLFKPSPNSYFFFLLIFFSFFFFFTENYNFMNKDINPPCFISVVYQKQHWSHIWSPVVIITGSLTAAQHHWRYCLSLPSPSHSTHSSLISSHPLGNWEAAPLARDAAPANGYLASVTSSLRCCSGWRSHVLSICCTAMTSAAQLAVVIRASSANSQLGKLHSAVSQYNLPLAPEHSKKPHKWLWTFSAPVKKLCPVVKQPHCSGGCIATRGQHRIPNSLFTRNRWTVFWAQYKYLHFCLRKQLRR